MPCLYGEKLARGPEAPLSPPPPPSPRANFTARLYRKNVSRAPLKGLKYQRAHALRGAAWPG